MTLSEPPEGIAIVGMAGRFPGAASVAAFWRNLSAGVESISFFSDDELEAPIIVTGDSRGASLVKAWGVLDQAEMFDASFFGFSHREAELMDPQHRVFLECSWEALEDAGYDAERYPGSIGVFAGSSINTYLLFSLLSRPETLESSGRFQTLISSDKDYLSTNVSYRLNLRGPSLVVQSACSTSLVAVATACQSLLTGQCDLALAGGVSITVPQRAGYFHERGGIGSADGHCRPFDAKASGTVGGNGAGVVVLKRLGEARADGDHVLAVIKGYAVNNDGSNKVGFTAPSVEGQAEAIATALALANVDPDTVSYVEAHGTGTALGDPVEIAALTEAFGHSGSRGSCAIGSVKANIGHLDAAAGVAGLIKTVLALRHRQIPPSLHFDTPNAEIDLVTGPFFVNTALREWHSTRGPRRAGVSSFGIGGTNAHLIVEEAPELRRGSESRPLQLLVLSARTAAGLVNAATNLAIHLREHPNADLADTAYTLQVGRRRFSHRRFLVCRDREEAIRALEQPDARSTPVAAPDPGAARVAFMFPGQGAQHVNMGRDLYRSEPTFRQDVDRCSEILAPFVGLDLRDALYPKPAAESGADDRLRQTLLAQPALFVVGYALARLWISWGVRPWAMIGHSIGEYVAACLAGVMGLEDALQLVATRARLVQSLPSGQMIAVPLSEADLREKLGEAASVAAVNSPGQCVLSGSAPVVEEYAARLSAAGVASQRLRTSHAFHSEMMHEILDPFADHVGRLQLHAPQIPFISNVTGTWITPAQARNPRYWADHLRQPVRFADGVRELAVSPRCVLLEVGPGQALAALARQHPAATSASVFSSLPHARSAGSELQSLLSGLGRLWQAGVNVDWSGVYSEERRQRVPLPTYPFERQRYWIEPATRAGRTEERAELKKEVNIDRWLYAPSWRRSPGVAALDPRSDATGARWLVLADETDLSAELVRRLSERGHQVRRVIAGRLFKRVSHDTFTIDPAVSSDYRAVMEALTSEGGPPSRLVHLWSLTSSPATSQGLLESQERGFLSLVNTVAAMGERGMREPTRFDVITGGVHDVTGEEELHPERATLLGACRVIPQEYPAVALRLIDLARGDRTGELDQVLAEVEGPPSDPVVAYRGGHRWVQAFEPLGPTGNRPAATRLRKGGVYLITGGLGAIGLTLAEHLARTAQARLVLVGRSANVADATRDARIRGLEQAGAEVLVAAADVADEPQMREVLRRSEARFGALNGVIHAAGVPHAGAWRAVSKTTRDDCETQFRAKIHGLLVLDRVLAGARLDFVMLQSSLAAIIGGLGLAAYSAANAFMDSFASLRNRSGATPWISVNWDAWAQDDDQSNGLRSAVAALALAPSEGCEVFDRVLARASRGPVVVSTGDLFTRLEQWVLRVTPAGPQPLAPNGALCHARPEIQSAFVAPRTELERTIARVWEELLGLDRVGVDDNFFELGGTSLVGIQVISRLGDELQTVIPTVALYEGPTVSSLATLVSAEPAIAASGEQSRARGQLRRQRAMRPAE